MESEEHLRERLRTALDTVFSTDPSTCDVLFLMIIAMGADFEFSNSWLDISITAHICTITAILHVIGHREYNIPTGGERTNKYHMSISSI